MTSQMVSSLTGAVNTSPQPSNSMPPETSLTETEEQEDEEGRTNSAEQISNFYGLILSLTTLFLFGIV